MTLLSPFALLLALAAIPIIGLYLLKVRQRRTTVPTLLFWDKVFKEKAPQSLFQKLRHPLSLLAQLLLLALLTLAVADPIFTSISGKPRKTVIIIDNSASMNVAGRLDRAKSIALSHVSAMRYFDSAAVIAVSGQALPISGMTDRQATLRERISSIAPTDGPTRLAPAIQLASSLLSADKEASILLLTDACVDSDPSLSNPNLHIHSVSSSGAQPDNIGITSFQARRSIADPAGYELFIQIESFSASPASFNVEISSGDTLIDALPITLTPGQTFRQTLTKTTASAASLTAKINHRDALAADNTAYAFLPAATRQSVLITGENSFFLTKAFQSIPLVDIVSAAKPSTLTVIHKTVPATLPAGPLLIINPQSSTDFWTDAGPLPNPGVQITSTPSTIMPGVKLENVLITEARKLTPSPNAPGLTVLATSLQGDPLLFSFNRPSGRILVLATSLDSGDIVLRSSFPILLSNALAWLTNTSAGYTPVTPTGQSITLPVPPGVTPTLLDPKGNSHPLALDAASGTATTGPLNQAGFWQLKLPTEDRTLPVSLSDARESNLTPQPLPPAPKDAAPLPTGSPLWFYLLGGAVLFFCLEWFLYHRRRIA